MRFHFIYNNRDFYYDFETGWIEGESDKLKDIRRALGVDFN